MRRVDITSLVEGYLFAAVLCWAFVGAGAMSSASAARLAGGLVLAWTALVVRKALWPGSAPVRAFERALRRPVQRHPEAPASYRAASYAITLACSQAGGDALQNRLRPLLRDIAVHRLASHRGIDFYTQPLTALPLLGEDLFALISEKEGLRRMHEGAPGVRARLLEEWLERLSAI